MSEQNVIEEKIEQKEETHAQVAEPDEIVLEPIPEAPADSSKVAIEYRAPEEIDLNDPELYFNRELSHLQFNARVLEQAMDENHPILNRLMFLCIFSSNMDEFFEIRVAGLKSQVDYNREKNGPDGMHPRKVLQLISEQAHKLVRRQYRILNDIIFPRLAKENIHFIRRSVWTEKQAAWVKKYFKDNVLPIISPVGLDPAHPFPRLANKTFNFVVELEGRDAFGRENGLAIVPAPSSLPRLVKLPDDVCEGGNNMVFLSSIIHAHADQLFPGMTVKGCFQFRLTRNADLEVDSDDIGLDLAGALRTELQSRHYGSSVRLEIADNCPNHIVDSLLAQFDLGESDLYRIDGPVNLSRLMAVLDLVDRPDLMYPPFSPGVPNKLAKSGGIFEAVRQRDYLMMHPFESFSPVIDMLNEAAKDPNVVAIRQTLYRTGARSPIANALVEAARNGKEVTVVIELRARFDEAENLALASRLQDAGAIVVYGVVRHKTHAKMILIVRREGNELTRYVHLGTGNYHAGNARLYTDYSFMTCDKDIGDDVHRVFQQLTGMSKELKIKKLLHAPFTLRDRLLEMIDQEAKNALAGEPARIIIKVNSLTEQRLVQALYKASQAGVKIDLIVRGICTLRPGIKGVSQNIRVRSIIGRFLEHTRVYYFFNNRNPLVYLSSADGMDRNLNNRVEVAFPIQDYKLARRVKKELEYYLNDNTQSWVLQTDGSYALSKPRKDDYRSAQRALLNDLADNAR
ncbi:polyphosphate kinase 1 [Maribrevibacterium harenarium]|uniref:Polyphosphate kinase n=1 Tax=Maribrevibacterium harenarium TaxID=2589817 RepID=A0A501W8I3_9GAMM|nr:polyphosphate kinase 1 [Maribrevibacterium harenarium]TPE45042.1 polyphosphate kinase 1 [Maribrevibacterium harenarium]